MATNPFVGRWLIHEFGRGRSVRQESPPVSHLTFGRELRGRYSIGTWSGDLVYAFAPGKVPSIAFEWKDDDSGESGPGRGIAQIVNGILVGRVSWRRADTVEFRAKIRQEVAVATSGSAAFELSAK
jgi:hypothetical protein